MPQRKSRQRLPYVSSICVTPGKRSISLFANNRLPSCVTCPIHMCYRTRSYVCHDSCTCVPWLIYVAWIVHMCSFTRSYVCHDSFIRTTWLIHMWDMTHSYVWHDSFICMTWLIPMCDLTHSNRTSRFLVIEFRPHQHPLRWIFSGLVQQKQGSLIEVYVKRGVRGVSSVISAFLGR